MDLNVWRSKRLSNRFAGFDEINVPECLTNLMNAIEVISRLLLDFEFNGILSMES